MRKLLPLFLLASLLGGLGAASASPASQISIPPQSELERYIWEVPTASNVPSLHTTDLRDELQAEISAFLAEGRRAPWFFVNGKGDAVVYFLEPTQTMYYLALAYPYLSPALQTQVESFVGSELASYDLLSAYSRYDWAEGLTYINGTVQADAARRRETSPPGPFWYCTIAGGCEGKGGGVRILPHVSRSTDSTISGSTPTGRATGTMWRVNGIPSRAHGASSPT
jgi:hypothetical protein